MELGRVTPCAGVKLGWVDLPHSEGGGVVPSFSFFLFFCSLYLLAGGAEGSGDARKLYGQDKFKTDRLLVKS